MGQLTRSPGEADRLPGEVYEGPSTAAPQREGDQVAPGPRDGEGAVAADEGGRGGVCGYQHIGSCPRYVPQDEHGQRIVHHGDEGRWLVGCRRTLQVTGDGTTRQANGHVPRQRYRFEAIHVRIDQDGRRVGAGKSEGLEGSVGFQRGVGPGARLDRGEEDVGRLCGRSILSQQPSLKQFTIAGQKLDAVDGAAHLDGIQDLPRRAAGVAPEAYRVGAPLQQRPEAAARRNRR